MATREKVKAARRAENKDRRPKAIAKDIRISPQKVRAVIDLIRGKSYDEAVAILANTNRAASPVVLKALNSAKANAEVNLGMSADRLYVAEIYADAGPILKRFIPRAKGGASGIHKRTSRVTVILNER
ncbi:MAG: 50S ribosomal protein L22 [Clostridiales bacterium]|nr:50S ribosomal protein L22 [Clostridiales bacterium]